MKRLSVLIVALAAICLSFKSEPQTITVVIDAGHGGKDFGAVHENLAEKEIVAALCSKMKSLNANKNVVLHFTRETDDFLELGERTKKINEIKPDLVLSLHVSQSPSKTANGIDIFVAKEHRNKETAQLYAVKLSEKLTKNHNVEVRDYLEGPFFVLRNSEGPALVVELGYLSNEKDRERLTDELQQEALAKTILEFISELK